MAILDEIKSHFRPTASTTGTDHAVGEVHEIPKEDHDVEASEKPSYNVAVAEPGVASVEAIQAVWGKNGKWIIAAG
jgi:hypothetical protein